MKKSSCGLNCLIILTINLLAARGQDLTKQQMDFDKERQDAMKGVATQQLSHQQLIEAPTEEDFWTDAESGSKMLTQKIFLAALQNGLQQKLVGVQRATASLPASAHMESGGGWSYGYLMSDPSCSSDTNQFYGVPPFSSSSWTTDNSPPQELPWATSTHTVSGTNGNGKMSYPSYNMPNIFCRSGYSRQLTNNFDMYGDPEAHLASFTYDFHKGTSGDAFRFSIAYVQGDTGIFYTNLPPTTYPNSWRRVSVIVPPYHSTNYPRMGFTVYKSSTGSSSPQAYLDTSVHWCRIETPPTNLRIVGPNNGIVRVEWNTSYGTNRWSLEFASNVEGLFTNYTGVITVTNNVMAYVDFGSTNPSRYYRLKHK